MKEHSCTKSKLEAVHKLRRNILKPSFAVAMKALLQDFDMITDDEIKIELVHAIGRCPHVILIDALLLVVSKGKDLTV